MAKIYNFDEFKNKMKKVSNRESQLETEILLSVIKYIYIHMEDQPEDIFEGITPNSDTNTLFKGDRNRFAATFVDLVHYWELSPLPNEEIPLDEEFERFPKVEDLCVFIDRKINKK